MSLFKHFLILATVVFLASFVFYLFQLPKPKTTKLTENNSLSISNPEPISKTTTDSETNALVPGKVVFDRNKKFSMTVPFTVQAPLLEWSDPHFQDACEEASSLMAIKWVQGKSFGTKVVTRDEILAISTWETEKYGNFHDTSAIDTVTRIFNAYFNYDDVSVNDDASVEGIVSELEKGNLVITPMNGQALKNPFFTQPGPERHMVLIKGFDPEKNVFITNDPGVSQGENYRYPVDVFINAIRDYPTGDHVPITEEKKAIIIVGKSLN